MDFGPALRARLLQDASVASAFGTRIYPETLPQAPTYPAATYQVAWSDTDYTHDGASGLAQARVQFDIYAKTYAAVIEYKNAVKAALSGWQGTAGSPSVSVRGVFWTNEMDLPVPELQRAGMAINRKTLEATIWFKEN